MLSYVSIKILQTAVSYKQMHWVENLCPYLFYQEVKCKTCLSYLNK